MFLWHVFVEMMYVSDCTSADIMSLTTSALATSCSPRHHVNCHVQIACSPSLCFRVTPLQHVYRQTDMSLKCTHRLWGPCCVSPPELGVGTSSRSGSSTEGTGQNLMYNQDRGNKTNTQLLSGLQTTTVYDQASHDILKLLTDFMSVVLSHRECVKISTVVKMKTIIFHKKSQVKLYFIVRDYKTPTRLISP